MRKSTGKTPGARHQTGIERANRRGECDDCMAVAVELFQVWCDDHCFDGDNLDGGFAYCGTCARRIERNHSSRYAGVAR